MTRSITLTRAAQTTGTVQDLIGFRFTVTVSAATNVSTSVFRFLRRPIDPANYGAGQVDVFNGLCTPEEMTALPLNNPTVDADPAFCRKAALDLVFGTQQEAEETWQQIQADVRALLQALARMDVLSVQQSVTISV